MVVACIVPPLGCLGESAGKLMVSISELISLPKPEPQKVRKRKTQGATVLTSTPYIDELNNKKKSKSIIKVQEVKKQTTDEKENNASILTSLNSSSPQPSSSYSKEIEITVN